MRILDPTPDKRSARLMHERAVALIPELRSRAVTNTWAGYVDSTPDGVPGIGEIDSLPELVRAAGFSGHGFGIGPGAGYLIADIVSGANPIFDPRPFHPDRFSKSAWARSQTSSATSVRLVDQQMRSLVEVASKSSLRGAPAEGAPRHL